MVQLTDQQYGAVLHTLTKIANGKNHTRLGRRYTRDEIVTMARECCDFVDMPYDKIRTVALEVVGEERRAF